MKKLLSWLVIVAIGGILAVKTYLYFTITEQLDEAITLASPFARVTYADVSSTLKGEVSVRNIKVRPYAVDFQIAIDEIRITFPDLKSLLFVQRDLRNRKLPRQLRVDLEHLQMQVEELKPHLTVADEEAAGWMRSGALGCAALENSDIATLLQRLGYNRVDISFSSGYRWDPVAKQLKFDSDFLWHEMTRSAMRVEFEKVATLSASSLTQPALRSISMEIEDRGYNGRFTNYCAQQDDISAGEFIDIHMALLKTALTDQGIKLGQELFEVYEYYLKSEGAVLISMFPDSTESLANIHLYKPSDLPRLLGLEISIGDRVIRDIRWDWDPQKMAEAVTAYQKRNEPPASQLPEPPLPPVIEKERPAVYRTLPVAQLQRHINREVIIEADDGRLLKGKLARITDRQVFVDVAMGSGYATLPVNREQIRSAQVLE